MKVIKDRNFFESSLDKISDERIKYIEKRIGIKLPISFLELVQDHDGGSPVLCDFEYFNVAVQEVWGSGIGSFLTLNESKFSDFLNTFLSPSEFFPEGLVAFAGNGGGDYICFDYREGKDNLDPPVVYWNRGADVGKDVSFVANNFKDFLSMLKEPED